MDLAEAELVNGVDGGVEEGDALAHGAFEDHAALVLVGVDAGLCGRDQAGGWSGGGEREGGRVCTDDFRGDVCFLVAIVFG